jgi:hypothetical protein
MNTCTQESDGEEGEGGGRRINFYFWGSNCCFFFTAFISVWFAFVLFVFLLTSMILFYSKNKSYK